jgi:mRNA interferase RelE/StbE
MTDCYKIKLRGVGYRLVYRVDEEAMFVTVIAVGRRDRSQMYETARARLKQPIGDE